MPVTVAR
jgi:hypothetical protein